MCEIKDMPLFRGCLLYYAKPIYAYSCLFMSIYVYLYLNEMGYVHTFVRKMRVFFAYRVMSVKMEILGR